MPMQRFTVSRDEKYYHAFPDVALTASERLVCVISECLHHKDRSYTRLALRDSGDGGQTWSEKRYLTPATSGLPYWNCPRITRLSDGRLVVVADSIGTKERSKEWGKLRNVLWFSSDDGRSWSEPLETPAQGIVPTRLLECFDGSWILSCHVCNPETGFLFQRAWISKNQGRAWEGPFVVAQKTGLNLCEASLVEVAPGTLVALLRENSGKGWDAYKTISHDGGRTWSEPVAFPLPGCHRPVAGFLQDDRVLITFRFMQGGKGWLGTWTQNFFAALTDRPSLLAERREEAWTRIMPLDYDRSPHSDLGYSGWVQFSNGDLYVVSYIVDDWPRAQIRGYRFNPAIFGLPEERREESHPRSDL